MELASCLVPTIFGAASKFMGNILGFFLNVLLFMISAKVFFPHMVVVMHGKSGNSVRETSVLAQ